MILNDYIHQQLAASHQHDLLEAAARARLVRHTRRHDATRPRLHLPLRRKAPRRRTTPQPCMHPANQITR